MTQITIDKKKYVLVPEKDYKSLQKKAALKTKPEKLLSVEEARTFSKKLIRKWAAAAK
jgi:PHD/YefM family antitoxin component YafN of YafNO toxin-antitoxin module